MPNRRKAKPAPAPAPSKPSQSPAPSPPQSLDALREIASLKEDVRILRGLLEAKEQSFRDAQRLACGSICCRAWFDADELKFNLLLFQLDKCGHVKRSIEVSLEFFPGYEAYDYCLVPTVTHTCSTAAEIFYGLDDCGCEPPEDEDIASLWIECDELVVVRDANGAHRGWEVDGEPLLTTHWSQDLGCEIVSLYQREGEPLLLSLPFSLVQAKLKQCAATADTHWQDALEEEMEYCEECGCRHARDVDEDVDEETDRAFEELNGVLRDVRKVLDDKVLERIQSATIP